MGGVVIAGKEVLGLGVLFINGNLVFSKVVGRPSRRFSVTFAATAPPQFEDFDVSNVISPNNCILEIIITDFLGFDKFGEIDLDGFLVAAKSVGVEDIMMLNNGYLCCIVNGDLVQMISELVAKNK
ncbi:hypothetical protein JHK87_023273 [Glycine soja]|nr:hypothetical protein JHK87_023273 [Glycine soja]